MQRVKKVNEKNTIGSCPSFLFHPSVFDRFFLRVQTDIVTLESTRSRGSIRAVSSHLR